MDLSPRQLDALHDGYEQLTAPADATPVRNVRARTKK